MNLLASGASESEIYIWDLNKPDNPMTPGSKSQVNTYNIKKVTDHCELFLKIYYCVPDHLII